MGRLDNLIRLQSFPVSANSAAEAVDGCDALRGQSELLDWDREPAWWGSDHDWAVQDVSGLVYDVS
jgi:hypothetical protein